VQCLERCLEAHPYAAHLPTFLQALLRKLEAERLVKVHKVLLAAESESSALTGEGEDAAPAADASESPGGNDKSGEGSNIATGSGGRRRRDEAKGIPRRHGGKVATTATSTTTGKDGKPHEEGK